MTDVADGGSDDGDEDIDEVQLGTSPPNKSTQQAIMDDIVAVWRQFRYIYINRTSPKRMIFCRDPLNGLYCDKLRFSEFFPCGPNNNQYSSAGTGMGLVSEAIVVELGNYSINVIPVEVNLVINE